MKCGCCGQPIPNEWGVKLDTLRNELSVDDTIIHVTPRETDILSVLMEKFGTVIPYNDLMYRIWPHDEIQKNTLKVYQCSINRKLRAAELPLVIKAYWGEGLEIVREAE